MSIGLDQPLPVIRDPDDALGPLDGVPDGDGAGAASSWDQHHAAGQLHLPGDSGSYFPYIAFLGTAGVLVFLVNHMYRSKQKPRRKKARPRRGPVTPKVAGV